MEGTQCELSSCRTRDFLPFICKYCDKSFCLEHRNPSNHNCIHVAETFDSNRDSSYGTNQQSKVGRNASNIIGSVSNRHDPSDYPQGSKRQHSNIRGYDQPIAGQQNESFVSKINKLQSNNHSNQKEKNISKTTSLMLLKSKAVGNKNIDADDRIYLNITFPMTNTKICVFYSKGMLLNELMQSISNSMEKSAYGRGKESNKNQYSLILYTDENPDWTQWDFNQILLNVFPSNKHSGDVHDVYIAPVLISDIMNAQHDLQRRQNRPPASPVPSPPPATSAVASTPTEPPVRDKYFPNLYKKEQLVYYKVSSESDELVEAIVKCPHVDDPTDIYYTIYIPSMNKEKQTVEARLSPCEKSNQISSNTPPKPKPMPPPSNIKPPKTYTDIPVLHIEIVHNNHSTLIPSVCPLSSNSGSWFQWNTNSNSDTNDPDISQLDVKQLKSLILQRYYYQVQTHYVNIPTNRQITEEMAHCLSSNGKKLVYKGRVLKDTDNLKAILTGNRATKAQPKYDREGNMIMKVLVVG